RMDLMVEYRLAAEIRREGATVGLFDSKKKSPTPCPNCKAGVSFTVHDDIATCARCQTDFATGYESDIRTVIEKNVKGRIEYPPHAVARAIGYASAIYGMATHGEEFHPELIEDHFRSQQRHGTAATGEASLVNDGIEGRGLRLRKLDDQRTGFLVVLVKGDRAARAKGNDFVQIYVIFRGSRSNVGVSNPEQAGYTEGGRNVDYAANFTGRQDPTWWAPKHIRIRRGFLELYKSMSIEIVVELRRLLGLYPKARVIVTGHSLGAALAVTCAHHLQYHLGATIDGGGPFCFPFCTPKVGNLAFCRDFKVQLGEKSHAMPGEANSSRLYIRGMNFSMHNDPVSTKGDYGYKHDRSDDLRSQGTDAANQSFSGKIMYGLRKSENKLIIFYQTPNLYDVGWYALWNIHQYSKMQEYFIGKALYRT
ncbi:lipase family protein, partial [Falsiroseomonas sp. E2-1-a20]|uniref:lipase family protein n=1 Tax=Falsiroseomonas sp. E2-1-a20 TaxID=3239300 RepID=UPI003F3E47D4